MVSENRFTWKDITLVGLVWQTLLLQKSLLGQTLFIQTGLPEQMLQGLTNFEVWTLILTELLERTLLPLIFLLG